MIHGVGVDDRGTHLFERIDDRAGQIGVVGDVGVGHHQDAERARGRAISAGRSGIGGSALLAQTTQHALLGGGQSLVMGALGVPSDLEGSPRVLGSDAHASGHVAEGATHLGCFPSVAHLARDDAQLVVTEGVAHHIGGRLELRAESAAVVARRVAGDEDGVAATDEAFHMPDEHLRGQAALVYGEPVALISNGLVRGIAHHHGTPDGFEERGPQHAEAIEQKRAWNAHHLHIGPICRLGHGQPPQVSRRRPSGPARISSTGNHSTAPLEPSSKGRCLHISKCCPLLPAPP